MIWSLVKWFKYCQLESKIMEKENLAWKEHLLISIFLNWRKNLADQNLKSWIILMESWLNPKNQSFPATNRIAVTIQKMREAITIFMEINKLLFLKNWGRLLDWVQTIHWQKKKREEFQFWRKIPSSIQKIQASLD